MQVGVRRLGITHYSNVMQAMQEFTNTRSDSTEDEIWLTEHFPVYTQGQAGKPEHLLLPGDIPVVQSDRGGQVTYHGPGQLIIYLLINIRRKKMFVSDLVAAIEQSIIHVLKQYDIDAQNRKDAPGVYVDAAKIAALGLRIRRMCSYHGLSFNIDMDLKPYLGINPCGMQGLEVTQLKNFGVEDELASVANLVLEQLITRLNYSGWRAL